MGQKESSKTQERFDFFLTSFEFLYVSATNIIHCYRTDHSAVTLELTLTENGRGGVLEI